MICYHGSDIIVNTPKILDPRRPLDFGGGFYVTSNKKQAINWAKKVAFRNNSKYKYINCYEFDIKKAELDLIVIKFEEPNEKWLDFIFDNRTGKDTGDYDIVIGPVADDSVYRVVVEYENGDIDKEQAVRKLKTENLCDQILFHNDKSLKYNKYIDTEVIDNE